MGRRNTDQRQIHHREHRDHRKDKEKRLNYERKKEARKSPRSQAGALSITNIAADGYDNPTIDCNIPYEKCCHG
jgi:hypothetical protein